MPQGEKELKSFVITHLKILQLYLSKQRISTKTSPLHLDKHFVTHFFAPSFSLSHGNLWFNFFKYFFYQNWIKVSGACHFFFFFMFRTLTAAGHNASVLLLLLHLLFTAQWMWIESLFCRSGNWGLWTFLLTCPRSASQDLKLSMFTGKSYALKHCQAERLLCLHVQKLPWDSWWG